MNPNSFVLKICKAYQQGLTMGLNDDLNSFIKYVRDITLSGEEIQANAIGWDEGQSQANELALTAARSQFLDSVHQ
jgi:hypothetical protein